jgi:hypothetical protein
MPLQKLTLRPGVNRENTRYTNENGWYESDKVRFRQGTPEKIGGWSRISTNIFLGICRSLWAWVTLGSVKLIGVGTSLKFYISQGGLYNDITPNKTVVTLTNPFATTNLSTTVTVTDAADGFINGDFVTFTGGTAVGGLTISGQYQLTYVSGSTYTITASSAATSTVAAGGGTVYAVYNINTGPSFAVSLSGWGASTWGSGPWGTGAAGLTDQIRIWNQYNYGQDLLFGPRGGGLYYWNATIGPTAKVFTVTIATPGIVTSTVSLPINTAITLTTTGALPTGLLVGTIYYVLTTGTTFSVSATVGGAAINTSGSQSGVHSISASGINATAISGASDVPIYQNLILVSDSSRFVFCMGTNALGDTVLDPMLIRWSDQESFVNWTPDITNQAGDVRLSHGSRIVATNQSRQEILVWTDSSLYSLQYVGPPYVWNTQIVGDNTSIAGPNAVAYANGVSYWMGVDKFYKYDGRTQTLNCDLRQFVFENINKNQFSQVYAGTNEGFNEVWWFYCSITGPNGTGTVLNPNTVIDRYVIYNYVENQGAGAWYYGTMGRTAWLDSGIRDYPLGATYDNNLVDHEFGLNDDTTGTPAAIEAYISSAEFDINDGHKFGFIWRVLPDISFSGSTATSPSVTMYLKPMQNSGSGYNTPASVGGSTTPNGAAVVTRTATLPIEQFTGQINTRVRGRQLVMEIRSTTLDVQWQLGSPRLDIREDGRR